MLELIAYPILLIAAVVAALIAASGLVGAVNLVSRSRDGLLNYYFYIVLVLQAFAMALSGRTLNMNVVTISGDGDIHPVVTWITRGASVLLLVLAIERIVTYYGRRQPRSGVTSAWLVLAFVIFWGCTVLSPALWSAHPKVSHEYLYPLVLGIAALLASLRESDRALESFRDGAFVFIIVGLLLIPVSPNTVIDLSYTQGLIPGLPRLAGLAPHSVSLAMLTQLALLCLWVRPMRSLLLTRAAWMLGLAVLFLAQSKTTWISFVLCSISMLMVRQGPKLWRAFGNRPGRTLSISVLVAVIACVLALAVTAMFGDMGGKAEHFFNSSEGAQLASLTGRDRIWAVAFEEWHRHPVFGYGPSLFDGPFQNSIGMPFAIHGHNQFVDTLARSGIVGATGLLIYALALLLFALRYCKSSGGLSLALFIALALRSISEVPLMMLGYNFEFIGHMLLLIVLAGQIRNASPATVAVPTNKPQEGMLPA